MAENENKETNEELADAAESNAENTENVAEVTEVTSEVTEDNVSKQGLVAIEEKKPAKKKIKEGKKPGLFIRIGRSLKKFWKSMKSELKRVTWINRKQTFTSTLLVLVCIAVSMIVIGFLDVGLSMGLEGLANLFG